MLKNMKGMNSEDQKKPTTANCALLNGSHIYVFAPVLHLANLLAKRQLPEQLEEFGQVLVATTMMNSCELPHRPIWITGTKKIMRCAQCCMLKKKLQSTHIAIQKGLSEEELQIREVRGMC